MLDKFISNGIDLGVVVLMMVFMLCVGLWLSRRIDNDDYMVAGRKLKWPIIGFHAMCTYVGVGTVMGALGSVYLIGVSGALYPLALALSFLVMALIAPRLRRQRPVTVGDIFTNRFSRILRIPNAVGVTSAMIGSSAAQMIAFGALGHVLLGIDTKLVIIIFSIAALLYTVLGGMLAVVYTDYVQGILMLVTLGCITMPVAIWKAGGLGAIFDAVPKDFLNVGAAGAPTIISYILIYGLLLSFYTSDGQMMIYAAHDIKHARKGAVFGFALILPFVLITIIIAFAANLLLPGMTVASEVFPRFAMEILPVGVVGIALGGICTAGMSTFDTSIIVASVTLMKDFIGPVFRKDKPLLSDKKEKLMNQAAAFAVGMVALALALSGSSIIDVINLGWDISACILAVPMIAALYWARATTAGALAAMVAGVLSWAYVYFLSDIGIAAYLAVPVSAVVLVVVSLLTKREDEAKLQKFYQGYGFVIGLKKDPAYLVEDSEA